jgi:hypothetical protein
MGFVGWWAARWTVGVFVLRREQSLVIGTTMAQLVPEEEEAEACPQ